MNLEGIIDVELHPERVELRAFVFGVATELESLVRSALEGAQSAPGGARS